ncbi:MAG: hypothetical protein COA47_16450 [Robiginitomaculum sp.]|nr:MAG: hypothetical protein COA47_16450 [Robiginitomaculum sp.]
MKLRKLLAATSIVALAAVPAQGLELLTAGLIEDSNNVLALELDTASTAVAGFYGLSMTLTSGGVFPAGTNILFTVTLPTGVTYRAGLGGGANGANVGTVAGAAGVSAGTNASLASGGAAGASSAVYRLNTPAGATAAIFFSLPLDINACGAADAGITITAVIDGTTTSIEGDTDGAVNTNTIRTCASAIAGVVASDETASNTVIALSAAPTNYQTLRELPAAAVAAGVFLPLGSVNYSITAGVDVSQPSVAPAVDPMVAGDLTSIVFDVQFADVAGIGGVQWRSLAPAVTVACSAPSAATNKSTCTLPGATGGLIDGVADLIEITSAAGLAAAPIVNQSINVANATVTFADRAAVDFIASEPGATGGLDGLRREGATFGFFDWNAEAGAVNSVYLVTGLPAGDMPFSVEFQNSRTGQNGVFTDTLAAAGIENGTYTFTSRGRLKTMNPGYSRADFEITFETTSTSIDVDRLISTGGVVAGYGAGANAAGAAIARQPNTDGDSGTSE